MSDAQRDFNQKKLATIDRIRRDGRLSASIRMIGAEIFSLIDFRTGDAWPSVLYLAEKLCIADRTIKRATVALRSAGYIEVVKVGRNNRYRPIFEALEKGTNCPLSDTEQGTICPVSEENRGQKRPEQGTISTENRGQKGPPISLEKTLGLSPVAPIESVGAPDGADARLSEGLGGFAGALERKLGAKTFKSWLSKVTFVSESADIVTLAAPNKFIADQVRNFFGGSILECWQAERPEIQRIDVIVARAVAPAEKSDVTSIASRRQAVSADARWLIETGIGIVSERLTVTRDVADKTIVSWLARCGRDAVGLRKIIADAAEQQLTGEPFRNVVKQRTKALLFADQSSLALPPVIVKRRAS